MVEGIKKIRIQDSIPSGFEKAFRLTVLAGSDEGWMFLVASPVSGSLEKKSFIIGRGEDCSIQIEDTKASRKHAVIEYDGEIFRVKDLGSSNGILVNQAPVDEAPLNEGMRIQVGRTLFEWRRPRELSPVTKGPSLPKSRPKGLINSQASSRSVAEASRSTGAIGSFTTASSGGPKPVKDTKKKSSPLLLIVVLGLGAVLFLGEEKTNTEQRRQPANQTRRIFPEAGSLYSGPEETEVSDDGQDYLSENVRKHLHMGMRELREGNYGRALSQFTTARSLDPTNRKVLMQIKITRQRMLEESKDLWRLGHLEARGGRYQAALNHFCQIMKIIKSDPEGALDRKVAANGQEVYGERFNKAKEAYQEVLSKMENHENRHHCSF